MGYDPCSSRDTARPIPHLGRRPDHRSAPPPKGLSKPDGDQLITIASGYRFFQNSKERMFESVMTVRRSSCTLMAFNPSLMGCVRMSFLRRAMLLCVGNNTTYAHVCQKEGTIATTHGERESA